MEKTLIRDWLLKKKPKVYTIIIQVYYNKLSNLKTALFVEWLALEIDVPIESINKSSVSSALRRYRLINNKGVNKLSGNKSKSNAFDDEIPNEIRFT